jgi:hypothetical protein
LLSLIKIYIIEEGGPNILNNGKEKAGGQVFFAIYNFAIYIIKTCDVSFP